MHTRSLRDPWHSRLLHTHIPPHMVSWLTDRGSLTARLKSRCRNFRVRVLFQGLRVPLRDEIALLNMAPGTFAWVREVLLCDAGIPLVFAHSVLPLPAVRGAWNLFAGMGARPLGEVLFTDPGVTRHPLRFRQITPRHALFPLLAPYTSRPVLQARRSLFFRHRRNLLVTEVFLEPATLL